MRRLFAAGLLLSHWSTFLSRLPTYRDFFTPAMALSLWLAYLGVKVLHELGHGLTLRHYNGYPESPDSLMSSGTLGWRLHDFQIQSARARAQQKAEPDTTPTNCSAPQVN